jgi:hypothetical protein
MTPLAVSASLAPRRVGYGCAARRCFRDGQAQRLSPVGSESACPRGRSDVAPEPTVLLE